MKLEESEVFQRLSRVMGVPPMNVSNWTRWYPGEVVFEVPRWGFERMDPHFWYWIADTFWFLPLIALVLYWGGFYLLRRHMRDKAPVDTPFLNVCIGIHYVQVIFWTATCCSRGNAYISRVIDNHPDDWFHHSLCHRVELSDSEMFLVMMTCWHKYVMLVDTFFLTLKKKNIQFFHLYHHTLVMLMPMKIFPYGEPVLFWFGQANLIQHVILYSILLLKHLKMPPIPGTAMFILLVELAQMAVCLFCGIYTLLVIRSGGDCVRHPVSLTYFNFIYVTMGLLVVKMIYDNRTKTKAKAPKKKIL